MLFLRLGLVIADWFGWQMSWLSYTESFFNEALKSWISCWFCSDDIKVWTVVLFEYQFCIDFVAVMSELKLVHYQYNYIEFLHLSWTHLILCYFVHVLLCFCVCHVGCMYQVIFVLDESFSLLFHYLLWFVQVITCMDVLAHNDYLFCQCLLANLT